MPYYLNSNQDKTPRPAIYSDLDILFLANPKTEDINVTVITYEEQTQGRR